MNFYQSVLLEKIFLENISQKVGFWGNYPLIFTLSDQTYDSKNYFKKIRLYATNLWSCKMNLKHFKFW